MTPREAYAASLLAEHCQIVCQPVQAQGRALWRVDIPGTMTTLLSGSTLVLMAERRLPAGLWQKLTKEMV